MINHMTRITRLSALSHLDTAGVPILDLRSSSQAAEPFPAPSPTTPPESPRDRCRLPVMSASGGSIDTGTAYGRPPPTTTRS